MKEKRSRYSRLLDSELKRIVGRLAHLPEVEKVIVFGSYARGRSDLFTDLDVLVVVNRSDCDFVTRTAALYGQLVPAVDIDLLVYTAGELRSLAGNPFIQYALASGKVVYEKSSSGTRLALAGAGD
ncbi:MAG: nucleotidyltransferase domain-containing protein [bacterium]|nr:nucleotidyltransferase domain-containing protein [bacterium]